MSRDSSRPRRPRRVAILAFDEVEVLDLAGPFEVFAVATRVARRLASAEPPPFDVALVTRNGKPATGRAGFRVEAHASIAEAGPADVVVVPGGVVTAVASDETVLEWVRRASRTAEVVASVCTGAFVLAAAGLLEGREATTHWEDAAELATLHPTVLVRSDRRWIDHGDVITSAGISAGIDMALHLVERLAGEELARLTARQMDYRWAHDEEAGVR